MKIFEKTTTLFETVRHFSTRVKEHLASDRASHIFQHLQNSEHSRALCAADCFYLLDHASTSFQLKRGYSYSERTIPFESIIHHVNLNADFMESTVRENFRDVRSRATARRFFLFVFLPVF